MIPLSHYLMLSAVLFVIGLWGVLTRRNGVGILMAIELILNSVNINFVAFSRWGFGDRDTGIVFPVFIITMAAAEAVVGLAIILSVFRSAQTIFVDKINLMKW